METQRLAVLLELSRLGSMRAVADATGSTTSTVSQQVATLAREVGVALVEPDGRRVRLTPAGRRLADHAVTVLAAVEAARADLSADAEPTGVLRVGGCASAVVDLLLPVVTALCRSHPRLRLLVHEHEPDEAFALLATDDLDLALVYDYDLAPAAFDRTLSVTPLGEVPWGLGVPAAADVPPSADAHRVLAAFADRPWIVNSRGGADEQVLRTLAATAGIVPDIAHRADSLDLVQRLVVAGLGVGLLPEGLAVRPGVRVLPLRRPRVVQRIHAVVRRGREGWPPLRLVLDRLGG